MNYYVNDRSESLAAFSLEANFPDKRTVNDRWAIILAGGDGSRLLPLTRRLTGDERPKQFCRIIGDGTLLEVTRRRVEHVLPAANTLVVLTEKHRRYFGNSLSGIPKENQIIQPKNIGTAPAILLSLMQLEKLDPEASVAFFPSDHFFSDDAGFMTEVDLAFDVADRNQNAVILMGIKPIQPDEEYGWIEPDFRSPVNADTSVWAVRRFWEKPERALAVELMDQGCLWNSFVMVGKVSGFLRMIRRTVPMLSQRFDMVRSHLGTIREKDAFERLYASELNTNFSTEILMSGPKDLAVMPVAGSGWSDLGSPKRVTSKLSELGWDPVDQLMQSSEKYYERTRSFRSQSV